MTSSNITLEQIAEAIFDDIVSNIVRQVSLSNISRHRTIDGYVDGVYKDAVTNYVVKTKDIYGQDRVKLKTSETSRYFECGNCGRQIAGGRFASHINKCLERDRR